MTIKRRDFLKYSGTLGAAAAVAGPTALWSPWARAQQTFTGVTYLPQSYKALSYGSNGFVDFLKSEGSDVFNVEFYDSGQLLKADEQLPALRAGNIDFMFHTTSYVTRSLPILGITGLPGVVGELYRNPERLAMGSPLFELINEELGKEDLHMISAGRGILEPEYIWSGPDNPVRSLEDLRGKKVRIVSFEATQALEAYDVAAVRIPSSETYVALQRGTIDAAIMNISTVVGRSLQEQYAYCYKLPTTAFTVAPFVLKRTWENMGSEQRELLEAAGRWYDDNFASHCNDVIYGQEYWPLMADAGIEMIEPSGEDLQALSQAAQSVRDAWVEEVGTEVGERAIALAMGEA
ncbi:TRAP transporter substrate-binding protein [Spiribacter pallidus]|jgi:TRAP-type C4-dicarboxylate transport system substrate-binding protein|uniref:TRAP transporter substrate-binding protein DctP n=1 Tax=Spiribacter pallidus TaxID=1987936 RepID=A0ABV3T977_9GAMM